jgi:hypothetical protein
MKLKYVLSEAQIQFIKDNYGNISQGKLASVLNISLSAIKYRTKLLGLSSPRAFIKKRIKWTQAEIEIVKEYYPIRRNTEVLAMLPGKTEKQLYVKCSALGIKKDKVFWGQYMKEIYETSPNYDKFKSFAFKKGHAAHNKGVPMPEYIREKVKHNWFQKGHTSNPNEQFDGAISIRNDARWGQIQFIRIAKSKWIPLHQLIWQQAGGELKSGHVITFKDGNVNNVAIENLEQISRAELMRRNSIVNYGKEYQSLSLTIAGFNRKLKKYYQQHLKRQ